MAKETTTEESQANKRNALFGMMQAQAKPPTEVKPLELPKAPVQAPRPVDLSRLRPSLQKEVKEGVSRQSLESLKVAAIFVQTTGSFLKTSPRVEEEMKLADSQLLRFYKMTQGNAEDIFKDCKTQYAYNQRQKIYSVSAMLEARPRIITVRLGDNFTELSLADQKGNLLEVLRQDDGKGVTFSKTG
ncbi:hypothetical protein H0O00_02300 [Candidatus Micrarchaeota archaeon]|nr:hypothetical protein [Candidatus Micrarchaeota archaeon]